MGMEVEVAKNGVPNSATNPLFVQGASSSGAVDVSNADADADFTNTKLGQMINARISALRGASGDWARLGCDFPLAITGESHTAVSEYLKVAAAAIGRDTTDNTMRLIESRQSTSALVTTLYRLLVDGIQRSFNLRTSAYEIVGGVDTIVGSLITAPLTAEIRSTGYVSAFQGRRFVVTSEGGAITVTNGFTATTPRLTIENGATNELIIRKIKLSCLLAGTTNLQYRIVIDPDARYSSGGTAVTLGARTNMNGGSATNAGFTAHYGAITATATDSDEREIEYGTIVNVTGNGVELDFADGLIVPASGTLLLYLMDAGAVATVAANVVLEEANIQ